jgi:CHAD domain-containing protein
MAGSYLERERKYDVPLDFVLPDLPGAVHRKLELSATYYDTDDGLLQERGITLRHRVGGDDDGWHLKAPHPGGRVELHARGADSAPPAELVALTRGLRFERPLETRAILHTTREAYRLETSEGDLVAEVADDSVAATVGSASDSVRWREVEVELGPAGSEKTDEELAALLTPAGATPSRHGSKLARAVGEAPVRQPLAGLAGLVDDYLQEQYARLTWGDMRLRRGDSAVHKTRVAVRRTRSTLRIFAPLFDERRAAHLDAELSWYAAVLGRVRDLDVVRHTVEQDLEDHQAKDPASNPPAPDGPRQVLESLAQMRAEGWQSLLGALDGDRYGALLRELHAWRRQPPMTAEAAADGGAVQAFVRRARKKADKRLASALAADDDPRDASVDPLLHRARKAAKRARYAAELARPALGRSAKRSARKYRERQDALGAIQDHVLVAAVLGEVAERQEASTEAGLVCGSLARRHAEAKSRIRSDWQ